ncbi:MAG: hypothetical protein ACSHX9_00285 [Luteolibacter sp.]
MATSGNEYFHGTSKRNARKILREGFRDWSWTAETPLLKYKAKQGIARWMHGGLYGSGTYVTSNWRSALHFGPVLFRVELQPGTRILSLDLPPDGKALDSLKRKFGREILTTSPWKVLPRNKRLTLEQAIQLVRHHSSIRDKYSILDQRWEKHEKLMFDLRNILVRYGIQGWGEPSDLGGIAIFAADRIKACEVVLSLPTEDLWRRCNTPDLQAACFASVEAMALACRSSRNRGAANTRKWVEKSNEELASRFH